jgi:hypothetical protein
MEKDLLLPHPGYKLYKDQAIFVGTFLGGPLGAGYLAAENFKRLGQEERVKKTWVLAIAATIIIFVGLFLIPGIEKIPSYIIPLVYSGIAQILIRRSQGAAIKAHIETRGHTFSTWRAVWIGLLGCLITLAILFTLLLLVDRELLQEILSSINPRPST